VAVRPSLSIVASAGSAVFAITKPTMGEAGWLMARRLIKIQQRERLAAVSITVLVTRIA
jgi:hypothetical protein